MRSRNGNGVIKMRAIAWKQNKTIRAAIFVSLLLTFLLSSVQAHAAETESLTIQTTVSGYSAMTQNGTAKVTLPDGTIITAGGSALEDGLLFVIEPVTEADAADVYAWISSCLQGKGSDLNVYDIYFVDSTGNRCDAAGETTITISLSSDYENPSVYRVATDGTDTQMGTSVENGMISFVMGENGYYALLESPEDTSGSSSGAGSSDSDSASGSETSTDTTGSSDSATSPETGDSQSLCLWLFMVIISGCGFAYIAAMHIRKFMQ